MDVAIATVREELWTVEECAAVEVVSPSWNLCAKLRPSKSNKVNPVASKINVINVTPRPAGQQHSSRKECFILLVDNFVEASLKNINSKASVALKVNKKGTSKWKAVNQGEFLAWLAVFLQGALCDNTQESSKESPNKPVETETGEYSSARFEDILHYMCENNQKKDSDVLLEIQSLQEKLSMSFRKICTPGKAVCIKKFKVHIKQQQELGGLRLVLLMDLDTGFICNFSIYSMSHFRGRFMPLTYVLQELLAPYYGGSYTVQLAVSAPVTGKILDEFSLRGVSFRFIDSLSDSAVLRNEPLSCFGSSSAQCEDNVCSSLGLSHFLGWDEPMLLPPTERGNNSVVFMQAFWLMVQLTCINSYLLHSEKSTTFLKDSSIYEFIKALSGELNTLDLFQKTTCERQSRGTSLNGGDDELRGSISSAGCSDMQYGRSTPENWLKPGMASGAVGLCNLGNTCYMNAVLQCLCSTSPLVKYFVSGKHRPAIVSGRGELANAFASVMTDMWFGDVKNVSPDVFWSAFSDLHPAFGKRTQQDAQEFLIYTLNGLHEDLKKNNGRRTSSGRESANGRVLGSFKEASIITRLLEGQLRYDTICLNCKKTNTTSEIFTVLSLPIPSTVHCSLEDCLNHFFGQDILSWNNTVHCSYCDSCQDAQVKTTLLKAPRILIFHLKRFDCKDRVKRKLKTEVRYPLRNLDMSPYCSAPFQWFPKYNLYAVVNHFGDLDWGHYTAYCRNSRTQLWSTFDDTRCFNVPESTIQNASAYILFYTNEPLGL
ncbi:ubiquitin carboxyl-terminal hydrolase 50 isoform X1 [Pleurodeles waltl]